MSNKATTLRIEYRKFNTFFLDYARSIHNGWMFMKMKQKYPVGTEIRFNLSVKDIISDVDISGTVSYEGPNDNNEEGVGISLSIQEETRSTLDRKIAETAEKLYGPHISSKMISLIK